jgi:hypothetical protein
MHGSHEIFYPLDVTDRFTIYNSPNIPQLAACNVSMSLQIITALLHDYCPCYIGNCVLGITTNIGN